MTGPGPGPGCRRPARGAALRVIPLAGIEERVAAVLPAGSLVTVTRPPRPKLLLLAGVVQPLNAVICHSFTGRPTRTKADQSRQHT